MAVNLSPVGGVAAQFLDNNGNVLTGGKIYTYAAGTTTPQASYTSAAGTTAHSNPIILDASGRVPGGEIWLTDGLQYKVAIYTADNVLIGTYDNVIGINSNFVNFVTSEEVQIATAGQTVFTLTTMQYQPGTNNLVVYVDGVNQVEGGSYSFVETSSTVVTFTSGLHVGAVVKFVSAELLSTGVVDSSSVVYTPAGSGAVATNVQTKLRETVSVKDFGAVGDGVTDDTAAIQLALNAGENGVVLFPEGSYRLTSTINVKSNTTVNAFGATFICEAADNAVAFYTPTSYVPATTYALTANAFEGYETITVSPSNSVNISADDLILIAKTTLLGGQMPYREMNNVKSVDTTTGVITLNAPLNFDYPTSASAYIAKVIPCQNSIWNGGVFDMSAVGLGAGDRSAIVGWWSRNCAVNHVTVKNYPYKTVDFYGAYQCSMSNIYGLKPSYVGAGQGYNGRFTYSRFCTANDIFSENVRHGFDISGGSDYAINNIVTSGRTSETYNSGPFLHGLLSKRTTINNVVSDNVYYGFIAGNGTFANDYDFTVNNVVASRCNNAVYAAFACDNFSISNVKSTKSLESAIYIVDCTKVTLSDIGVNASINTLQPEILIYGGNDVVLSNCVVNSFSCTTDVVYLWNAKVTFSGSRITSSVNTASSIKINGVNAEAIINDCYVDHSGTSHAIHATNASNVKVSNSIVKNRTVNSTIAVATANVVKINDNQLSGIGATPTRAVWVDGANNAQINDNFIFTADEGVRIDATPGRPPVVSGNQIYGCNNALRTTASTTKAVFSNNYAEDVTNKMTNTSLLFVPSIPFIQGGVNSRGDNSVTVVTGVDAEIQRFATNLTANRTVTLSIATGTVFEGASFTIVRQGLGAFTLEVRSGSGASLKTIPSGTAATVVATYAQGDWRLTSYGEL